MYFHSVNEALMMDGHGGYVWAAYAISVLVLSLILLAPRRRQQRFLRQLAGEQKRRQQGLTANTEVN